MKKKSFRKKIKHRRTKKKYGGMDVSPIYPSGLRLENKSRSTLKPLPSSSVSSLTRKTVPAEKVDSWEKTVNLNPGTIVYNEKTSIWLMLRNTYDMNARKHEWALIKEQCLDRFNNKPCKILNSVFSRYKVSDDIKIHNTICGLLYIVGILTEKLKYKCNLVIKGGLAIQLSISDISKIREDADTTLDEYYDILDNYSTKDIDLLLLPTNTETKLGRDGVYYAKQISSMIMWIFSGISPKKNTNAQKPTAQSTSLNTEPVAGQPAEETLPYRLSLLDLSKKTVPEEQIVKLSMVTNKGFVAAMDININLPKEQQLYSPITSIEQIWQDFITINYDADTPDKEKVRDDFTKTGYFSESLDGSSVIYIPLNLKLLRVSTDALIFDRIYHLYKFKIMPLNKMRVIKEKIDIEQNNEKKDRLWDELSELNTSMHVAGNIYLSSIKRSLNVLIAADIIRKKTREGVIITKQDIFDIYLQNFVEKYNVPLTPEEIDALDINGMRDITRIYNMNLTPQQFELLDNSTMKELVVAHNISFSPEQKKILVDFLFTA